MLRAMSCDASCFADVERRVKNDERKVDFRCQNKGSGYMKGHFLLAFKTKLHGSKIDVDHSFELRLAFHANKNTLVLKDESKIMEVFWKKLTFDVRIRDQDIF